MELLKVFMSVAVSINPLGAVPIYIGLTRYHSREGKKHTITTASIAVFVVLALSAVLGEGILKLFSISVASFQVGGGILVMLLAISMMNAQTAPVRQTQEEKQEAFSKENIAVVPLAIPLLAGPGSISTIIIAANKAIYWYEFLGLVIVSLMVAGLSWGALKLADPISKFLGQTGINIATRIMGLLLAAIAIEFMTDGLKTLLPVLRG
jgi:multiple antibiotic resistance protein